MQKKVLQRKDFIDLNKNPFFVGKSIHINFRKTKYPLFRIGITVTKKWDCAVKRNLFKRRVKHCLKKQGNLPKYTDLQVKPRRNKKPTFDEIQTDFQTFLTQNLV